MNTKNKTWKLIKEWRKKYNESPNGWPVVQLIGSDYMEASRAGQKEKKRAQK